VKDLILSEQEIKDTVQLYKEKHELDISTLTQEMEAKNKANEKKYRTMSVAALNKAEKIHAAKVEELTSKYTQEKDELRKFHLMSTLALKQVIDSNISSSLSFNVSRKHKMRSKMRLTC
jgi:hypothetical protein